MGRAAISFTALGVLQRGLALLLLPLLARAMPVEEFGAASLLVVGNVLLVALFGASTDQAVLHATANESKGPRERGIICAARIWLLYVIPPGALILAAVVWFHAPSFLGVKGELWAVEILAAGLGAFAISYAAPRLRAQRRIRAYAILTAVTVLITVALRVSLVVVLQQGALGWAVADLVTAFFSFSVAVAIVRSDDFRGAAPRLVSLIRFALPLLPSSLSLWAMTSLNRPLAALVLPLDAVGLLSAAASAAGAALILCVELNRALQPEFARDGFPAPMRNSAAAMRILLWAGPTASVLTCLFTPVYVRVVLPAPFASIEPTLAILSLIPVFWTLWAIANNITIFTARDTRWSWIGTLAGAAVLGACTVPVGSAFGVEGIAIVTVAAYVTMAATALITLRLLRLEVSLRAGGLTAMWLATSSTAVGIAMFPLIFQAGTPICILCTATATLICLFQGARLRRGLRKADVN